MRKTVFVLALALLFLVPFGNAQSAKLKTLDVAYFQTGSGHYVALTFTASADAAANPSLSYLVYRQQLVAKTDVCSTAAMTQLGTTSVTTFNDTNVLVGARYCYAVTATLNGGESEFSNVASAVIPIAPPAGLGAVGK